MRIFTVRFVSESSCRRRRETVEVTEWAGSDIPHSVNLIGRDFVITCDCDGRGARDRHRRCVHAAVYLTWRRQGASQIRPWDPTEKDLPMYGVDDAGFIHQFRNRKWVKLSHYSRPLQCKVEECVPQGTEARFYHDGSSIKKSAELEFP